MLKSTTTAPSASTSRFDPGAALDWNRIPYRVYHNNDLRSNMRKHLEQLLSDNPAAAQPVSEAIKANFQTNIEDLKDDKIYNESSVSTATSRLLSIMKRAYEGLTGSKIESQTELPSERSTVITEFVIFLSDSEKENVQLLWENKAPRVFDVHITQLQEQLERGPIEYNLQQTTWENWQAILAKVGFPSLSCWPVTEQGL
jgi:hypothetical protein